MHVRMVMMGIGMWALAACWSSPPPPAEPVARPAAQAPVVPAPTPVAEGGETSPAGTALAGMATFRDAMCKCTAKPCVDQVTEEMTEWGKRLAREGGARKPDKVADADIEKMSAITEAMIQCMTAAMTGGVAQGGVG